MKTAIQPTERHTATILGIPVDVLGFAETLGKLETFLAGEKPRIVATADASGLVIAQTDPDFRQILLSADLVTPDSIGVIWAGRRRGIRFEGRVSGVDLVDRLCQLSSEKGYRIFFLGADPGVAEMAAEKMKLRHPGCHIVGTRHGYFPAADDDLVAAEVAEAKPDILFVAMGIPRQEKFIVKTMPVIRAKVAMGVGGSFDVFSGQVRRAPVWVQRLNLEWLWRTLANPKKIAKAKHLPSFVWRVLRTKE